MWNFSEHHFINLINNLADIMIMMEPPFNALIKQIFTDPKDQNRLFSALKDGTLKFPNSVSSTTKKVALLKVSKQNYVGMIVGKKGELSSRPLSVLSFHNSM